MIKNYVYVQYTITLISLCL